VNKEVSARVILLIPEIQLILFILFILSILFILFILFILLIQREMGRGARVGQQLPEMSLATAQRMLNGCGWAWGPAQNGQR
jgi:hypothetical protein